jgi:hypothetical protein
MQGRQTRVLTFGALVGLAALLIVTGVVIATRPTPPDVETRKLAEFTENGVTVVISLDRAGVAYTLNATYTPKDPTFHLYSKDMPLTGIDGVGRPTRMDIVGGNGVEPAGEIVASADVIEDRQPGFDQPFLVYPDGPVTLSQPVTIANPKAASAVLSITYMSCSSQGLCLPPVEARAVEIKIGS